MEPTSGAHAGTSGTDAVEGAHRLGDAEDGAGERVRVMATGEVWRRFVEVNPEGATSGAWREEARCGELLHHARQAIRRTRGEQTGGCRLDIHAADRFGDGRTRIHGLVMTIEAGTAYAPATATVSAGDWV